MPRLQGEVVGPAWASRTVWFCFLLPGTLSPDGERTGRRGGTSASLLASLTPPPQPRPQAGPHHCGHGADSAPLGQAGPAEADGEARGAGGLP